MKIHKYVKIEQHATEQEIKREIVKYKISRRKKITKIRAGKK